MSERKERVISMNEILDDFNFIVGMHTVIANLIHPEYSDSDRDNFILIKIVKSIYLTYKEHQLKQFAKDILEMSYDHLDSIPPR